MKITRACDYAMRALLYMANKPEGTVFMRSDLSRLSDVPDSFLGKILQNLAKSDILVSERGKRGGFRLEKAPDEISMYDVMLAVEGEIQITDCLSDSEYCTKVEYCKAHKKWLFIQDLFIEQLKEAKLKDLL
jgi:Rrf2 family protein